MCTYKTKYGAPCTQFATDDSLVCQAHSAKKINLLNLRRDYAQLGPLFKDRLEEIVITGEPMEVLAAHKVWSEMVGVKDLPPVGSGIEEEELEYSKRSLHQKLESVISNLAKRRTA